MRHKYITFLGAVVLIFSLNAEDISDTRTSAVAAAQDCQNMLSDAQKTVKGINVSGISNVVGTILKNMANNILNDVSRYSTMEDTTSAPQEDTVSEDTTDQNLQDKIQKAIILNLQTIQNKSSTLNIPNAKAQDMEQIKAQIAESLNSADVAASGAINSNKNKK